MFLRAIQRIPFKRRPMHANAESRWFVRAGSDASGSFGYQFSGVENSSTIL